MAVMTAAEARTYHLVGITSTNEDTEIDEAIARASVWAAEWLGYPAASAGAEATLESATYTHYNEPGAGGVEVVSGRMTQLPVIPVASITSVHVDEDWDYGAGDLVASGDQVLDGVNGILHLRPDASDSFSPVLRAVKIVYVAGYTTIPGPIVQAVGMLTRHLWDNRKRQGKSSVSVGGNSASLRPARMPDEVADLLWPYRILRGGAA
jgi:hypothetical protein